MKNDASLFLRVFVIRFRDLLSLIFGIVIIHKKSGLLAEMCDSDNDAFESADEEIEDARQQVAKITGEKSSTLSKPASDVENKVNLDKSVDTEHEIEQEPKKIAIGNIVLPDIEKDTDGKLLMEKATDSKKSSTVEEGWDNFDDDWGDFNVDTNENKLKTQSTIKPENETKTSFKDVDIDEVELKLKEFMKGQEDPPVSYVFDRLTRQESKEEDSGQSWGAWKPSWGGAAVSFLSSASKSVASITTNITQVIESGIGVPNPEELAKRQAEELAKLKADGYIADEEPVSTPENLGTDRFGFDQIFSGVTQISSKVITGGLDTLEGIGKKTMTILQENDPGLLNKRSLLGMGNDGVVLSQVLREAKEKTEEREKNLKQVQKHLYKKKLHFESLFDDYHGLVHLEALEMLSKQAALKLESLLAPLTGNALDELRETMSEVKELCELPESENDDADGTHSVDELGKKLNEAVTDLDEVNVDFQDLLKCWKDNMEWLKDESFSRTTQQIFEKAMHALAQTTALCVLRMHKLAEILLILEHHSTANEADALVQLTTVFCWHLSGVAARFSAELSNRKNESNSRRSSGEDSDNSLITNIFLEGSNSISYVQNAFQLFIPILQIGAA
ncbi:protein FAM114A2 [Malaya genurostris]|uniref:protein FAM114A2 n=1 Tax=Malaya genurostris TaxID=325434 RepID=UPI0026F3EF03|nr:protein FAM114A2 [Malaya genurostris]